jgi:hypothetical protein
MNRHHLAILVFQRDGMCVAAKLDPKHRCQGRLTLEHVPIRGRNALQRKAPDEPWCSLALCLGAQSEYWGEAHREAERGYLAGLYPEPR